MARDRISLKRLEALAKHFNRAAGTPEMPWNPRKEGEMSMKANVGCFYVSSSMTGWNLYQMVNEDGGVREVLYAETARGLYDLMQAWLLGYAYATTHRSA